MAVTAGCGGVTEGCVICEPESATLPPIPRPVVDPLSRIVTPTRVGGSRRPRTLDFKRYPFSFYYLPSSSAHRAAPADDARITLALARATLRCFVAIPRRKLGCKLRNTPAACDRLTRQRPLKIKSLDFSSSGKNYNDSYNFIFFIV